MSTTNQIRNLFANSTLVYNVPHIQKNVLAEYDQLSQLALSHTCGLYRDIHENFRLATLTIRDVGFDVRNPDLVFIDHYFVKKPTNRDWVPKGSKYIAKKIWMPATEKESVWYHTDDYKGIVTPSGVLLRCSFFIYDSMFGSGIREFWDLPRDSPKKRFTVADYRDLYVGRYKKEKTEGSPEKIHSQYWKAGGESVIIWCVPDNMHGTLVFHDNLAFVGGVFCDIDSPTYLGCLESHVS
ncbi:hypothetical protein C8R43DRAFT_963759 [Mycena crocata]|nr:hypothetical protein C8R43DRAFT_963759 [Mycena crocata]